MLVTLFRDLQVPRVQTDKAGTFPTLQQNKVGTDASNDNIMPSFWGQPQFQLLEYPASNLWFNMKLHPMTKEILLVWLPLDLIITFSEVQV